MPEIKANIRVSSATIGGSLSPTVSSVGGDIEQSRPARWGGIVGTLSNQTDLQNALNSKASSSDIPTKTSQLVNDSGFLTEHQSLANYDTKAEVNTKIQNEDTAVKAWADAKFLTSHQSLADYSTTAQMNAAIAAHHDSTKQDTLVSGINIKTINSVSIVGSGNISIASPTIGYEEVE